VLAALWLSIICLALEFCGLLMGISMFMVTLNGFGEANREGTGRVAPVLS